MNKISKILIVISIVAGALAPTTSQAGWWNKFRLTLPMYHGFGYQWDVWEEEEEEVDPYPGDYECRSRYNMCKIRVEDGVYGEIYHFARQAYDCLDSICQDGWYGPAPY